MKSKSLKRALFDYGVAEVEDTENCEAGDEGESSTRSRPIDFIVPNSKTKMAGSTPVASKEKNVSENVQAFITLPPLFSPIRTALC